jgi:voltage-gated sodium channel
VLSTRAVEVAFPMVQLCARVADSQVFQRFITLVILLAAVLVGIETNPDLVHEWGTILHIGDKVIIGIFTAEVVIKMIARGKRWYLFFTDPWNVFDFIIVVACFLPLDTTYITVLRLLRLLRVLRLVRALPKLQILVGALIKSIPSMAYVSLLLFLVFYIYGVAAVFLFGHNDPIHFKHLPIAMVSLFRAVTLEDWTDIMYIQMYGCEGYGYGGNEALCTQSQAHPVLGALFFISFILLGTMIMLNLFVGVIMNGMSEAQKETEQARAAETAAQRGAGAPSLKEELSALANTIGSLQAQIASIQQKTEQQRGKARRGGWQDA